MVKLDRLVKELKPLLPGLLLLAIVLGCGYYTGNSGEPQATTAVAAGAQVACAVSRE